MIVEHAMNKWGI